MSLCTIINAHVTDQVIQLSNLPRIASGSKNALQIRCNFCGKWEGCGKTAVFYRTEDDAYHVPVVEGLVTVPWEVLVDEGYFWLGFMGEDDLTRTTEAIRIEVAKGALTVATATPQEPTPDIYQQIMAAYGTTERMLALEKARLDALVAVRTSDGTAEYRFEGNKFRAIITTNGINAHLWLEASELYSQTNEYYAGDFDIPLSVAPLGDVCSGDTDGTDLQLELHVVSVDADAGTAKVSVVFSQPTEIEQGAGGLFRTFYPVAYPSIAELADIRAGYNGENYAVAGDAVRATQEHVDDHDRRIETLEKAGGGGGGGGTDIHIPYEYIWTAPGYDQEVSGSAGQEYYFKLNELSDPNTVTRGLYLIAADGTSKLIFQANEIAVGTERSFEAPIDFVKIRLYLGYATKPENNKVSFYFYPSNTGDEPLPDADLAEIKEITEKNAKDISNIVEYVGFNNTYEYVWSKAQRDETVSGSAGQKYYFRLNELSDPNAKVRGLYLFDANGSYKLVLQDMVVGREYSFEAPIDFAKIRLYLGYETPAENNVVSFSFGSNTANIKMLSEAITLSANVLPVNYLSGIQKPLIVGDSLSAGHCYTGGVEGVNNITRRSCSWHNLLFGKELNTPTSYIGRSGARAIDVLNEFGDELTNISHYDTIIVFLGTNKEADNIGTVGDVVDAYTDTPTETSIGRYSKLLKTIDNYASPYALKIACGLVPSNYADRSEYIKLTANTIGGWCFADLNQYEYLFKRLTDNHDGTHFTPIGYAEYAGIMKLALNKAILENPELTKYTINVDIDG